MAWVGQAKLAQMKRKMKHRNKRQPPAAAYKAPAAEAWWCAPRDAERERERERGAALVSQVGCSHTQGAPDVRPAAAHRAATRESERGRERERSCAGLSAQVPDSRVPERFSLIIPARRSHRAEHAAAAWSTVPAAALALAKRFPEVRCVRKVLTHLVLRDAHLPAVQALPTALPFLATAEAVRRQAPQLRYVARALGEG
jgi:hypothetical protein